MVLEIQEKYSMFCVKWQVNSQVVDAVTVELHQDPLAKLDEGQQKVNTRLLRDDLTVANTRDQ
ncbi:MAG: hypothetical protein AAB116_25245 [Candidatus Poribacteria bacterium]